MKLSRRKGIWLLETENKTYYSIDIKQIIKTAVDLMQINSFTEKLYNKLYKGKDYVL